MHFIKVFKDMLNESLNDVVYVKIKIILMLASFIWGIIILQHSEIILFYQENYPRVYVSFINYFLMSSLSILDVIYKILNYIYLKKQEPKVDPDYEFIVKIDNEFADELSEKLNNNNNFLTDVTQKVNNYDISQQKISNEVPSKINIPKKKNYKIYDEEIFYL
jgi:hypothetical protein